jgi:hypothetical protein
MALAVGRGWFVFEAAPGMDRSASTKSSTRLSELARFLTKWSGKFALDAAKLVIDESRDPYLHAD